MSDHQDRVAINKIRKGVTCVICCHNSAKRLPPTLKHLSEQEVQLECPWEVLVIDNCSNDDTTQVALKIWEEKPAAPMRIVRESQLGLTHARSRGFSEARFEYVSFVDDDNWVNHDWVSRVYEIMQQNTNIGACGGYNEAAFESTPPIWFDHFKGCYAVGPQSAKAGQIESRDCLWGAGLTVRKSAWLQLLANGFQYRTIDRYGEELSSGGDTELVLALRLNDWELWYDPELRLRHFIPISRLQLSYLRSLRRAIGAAGVLVEPYRIAYKMESQTPTSRLRSNWLLKCIGAFFRLLYYQLRARLNCCISKKKLEDEDFWSLYSELTIGRLNLLTRARGNIEKSFEEVRRLSTTAPRDNF